jgi:hypothetical protein
MPKKKTPGHRPGAILKPSLICIRSIIIKNGAGIFKREKGSLRLNRVEIFLQPALFCPKMVNANSRSSKIYGKIYELQCSWNCFSP